MKSNLVAFHMRCSCMLFTFGTQPIGKGRFRILGGGQGLEYCGGEGGGGEGGGATSQQAHGVVTTSMRRNVVISTSCAH